MQARDASGRRRLVDDRTAPRGIQRCSYLCGWDAGGFGEVTREIPLFCRGAPTTSAGHRESDLLNSADSFMFPRLTQGLGIGQSEPTRRRRTGMSLSVLKMPGKLRHAFRSWNQSGALVLCPSGRAAA